jgi:hypothetical protein
MFRGMPSAPMLVQRAQAGICGMQHFFLEETEYRENKEREDMDKTRKVKNKGSFVATHLVY